MAAIGIDAGTSLVKAVLFDDDLRPIDVATAKVPVRRPHSGWSEQDPREVRAAVDGVIRQVAPAGVHIDFMGITAQGDGCWLVDQAGQPVGPALLWNDGRSADIVEDWEADGLMAEAFTVTGSYGNAGLAHAQLAWLRTHDPARVDSAATLLSCGGWLYLGLTDSPVLDVSDACNPLLDARTDTYADGLFEHLGLSWARRLMPRVVTGTERLAPLSDAAAGRTGLAVGTPVVLAPYDVVSTAVGVGAVPVGAAFAVLGTTLCIGTSVDDPRLDRAAAGMSLATGVPGRRLLAYATLAGTEVMDWWARLLGLESAADVTALAATATPRRDTPLLLPYLSPAGERAPFRDSAARGSLSGVHFEHDRADIARAVVEGLSYAVRDCLIATGPIPTELTVCGGGAGSDMWCQVLADVTSTRVVRADQGQVGARGAVMTGLVSLGHAPDMDSLVDSTIRPGRTFHPSPDTERHDDGFARYLAARQTAG